MEEEKIFRERLLLHIKAIKDRDIEAYSNTISRKFQVVNLTAGGGIFKGRENSIQLHRNWFSDRWDLETEVLETEIYGDTARALVRMKLMIYPSEADPFLEDTFWTLIFARESGEWRMAFNQSTEIKK